MAQYIASPDAGAGGDALSEPPTEGPDLPFLWPALVLYTTLDKCSSWNTQPHNEIKTAGPTTHHNSSPCYCMQPAEGRATSSQATHACGMLLMTSYLVSDRTMTCCLGLSKLTPGMDG